ncbi:hypothetical protein COE25_26615 [Bacillus sp. AFS031507]|nr:hypothetical protein COE25_26615 [Bacillus sp. AFS031507]
MVGQFPFNLFDSHNTLQATILYHKFGTFCPSTPEAPKEMALFKLQTALISELKERELVFKGDGFALYRDK